MSFPRPLLARPDAEDLIRKLTPGAGRRKIKTAANILICCDERFAASREPHEPALLVFPRFTAGRELPMTVLSPAMACLKLMECNLNARNLSDHGLSMLAELTRKVPAIAVDCGSYQQLDSVADLLAKFSLRPGNLHNLVLACAPPKQGAEGEPSVHPPALASAAPAEPVPPGEPTASSRQTAANKKLTIGMATYDDYDGVYFTLQAIRMYHPEVLDEVEFLVIDNNPTGQCAKGLKELESWIPNYRYVPKTSVSGTAIRDWVFREARGEFVLCVDCHILLVPGALRRLLEYFQANPDTGDLVQGPMIYDDLKTYSTHFKPGWEAGMYGRWDCDPAGADPDRPPFEIPMQGLGLFGCRRSAEPAVGNRRVELERFRQDIKSACPSGVVAAWLLQYPPRTLAARLSVRLPPGYTGALVVPSPWGRRRRVAAAATWNAR